MVNSSEIKFFDYSAFNADKVGASSSNAAGENSQNNSNSGKKIEIDSTGGFSAAAGDVSAAEIQLSEPKAKIVQPGRGISPKIEFDQESFLGLSQKEAIVAQIDLRHSRLLAPNITGDIYTIKNQLVHDQPYDVEEFAAVCRSTIALFVPHLTIRTERLITSVFNLVLGKLCEIEEEKFGSQGYYQKKHRALDCLTLFENLTKLETAKVAIRNDVIDFLSQIKFSPSHLKEQFKQTFLSRCAECLKGWLKEGNQEVGPKIKEIEAAFDEALTSVGLTHKGNAIFGSEIHEFANKISSSYEHLSLIVCQERPD
jgi:hypothetical protein